MPANIFKSLTRLMLLTLAFFSISASLSVGQTYSFRKYTVEDGLPENRVMSVWQDSYGFLWLSSKNGLSRFDGNEIITYGLQDGLPGLFVRGFGEDSTRTIWVQTFEGIAEYDGKRFIPYPLPEDFPFDNLSSGMVIDGKWNIWLTASDSTGKSHLISFLDGNYRVWGDIDPLFRNLDVRSITYHQFTGETYLNIGGYIYSWDTNGITRITDIEVSGLFCTKEKVMAFTGDITYELSQSGMIALNPVEITENWIKPVLTMPDREGSYYITDFNKKLYLEWPYGHANGSVQDSDSAIWIAGEDGLIKLLSGSIKNYTRADGIQPNTWAVVEDKDGDIFFGSVNGTLMKYDHKDIMRINEISDFNILSFTIGSKRLSDGRCWFTTFRGIIEWDGETFRHLDFIKEQAECIYEDIEKGIILVGSASEGLYMISKTDTLIFRDPVPEKIGYIRDICKDESGLYWIVTHKSIYRFDGTKFEGFNEISNPLRNGFTCDIDSSGTTWFGGDEGLLWYDSDNNVFSAALPSSENFPVRFIKVMDDGRLMAGRVGDFIILDIEKWKRGDLQFYTIYDRSNGFMGGGCIQNGIMKDSKGKYWILGSETVTLFDPRDERVNSNPPRIYLSSLDILDDHLNWNRRFDFNIYKKENTSRLILRHFENNIRLNVIGISTHRPEKVLYRYRLIGSATKWSQPTPERMIVLPGLNPGKHTFEVQACSAEGIWSTESASIELYIRPAYWQTILFRVAFSTLLVVLVVVTILYINKRRKEIKETRIKTVRDYYRLQMGKFIQQFDPHFTFNVLNSVLEFINSGRKEEAEEYLLRFSRLLRVVITEEGYLRHLGEELDFIRDYCEMQKIKMGNRFNYSINVENIAARDILVPRMVIHNFVENAAKWGIGPLPEGGRIDITVKGTGPYLVLVTDTGIGREAASKKSIKGTGKGLKVTHELIEMLNKYNRSKIILEINDLTETYGDRKGTRVLISFPEKYNYYLAD